MRSKGKLISEEEIRALIDYNQEEELLKAYEKTHRRLLELNQKKEQLKQEIWQTLQQSAYWKVSPSITNIIFDLFEEREIAANRLKKIELGLEEILFKKLKKKFGIDRMKIEGNTLFLSYEN